jgi:sugar lactone lactonase YvrE
MTRSAVSLTVLILAASPAGARYRIDGFAGKGYGDGGPAIAASVNLVSTDGPGDALTDPAGNVLFTDRLNHKVRKVDPSGVITTVAGNGSPGTDGDGGPATLARLHDPDAIALDAAGNLYVAERLGYVVRRIDAATGVITTIAGTGLPTGQLDGPGGDPRDDLGDGGPAALATFDQPVALAFDAAGNLFVSDYDNQRIRRIEPTTKIITTVVNTSGSGGCPTANGTAAASTKVGDPGGLHFDAAGRLYFAELGCGRVRRMEPGGNNPISTVAGRGPGAPLDGDGGPAPAAGLALVFRYALVPAGCGTATPCELYIGDGGHHAVRYVNASGIIDTVVNEAGTSGNSADPGVAAAAQLVMPGAHRGPNGRVVVTDAGFGANRLRIYDPATGQIDRFAGDGQGGYGGDGLPATQARLNRPTGLARDAAGAIVIADHENYRVRRVAPDRTIGTIAGTFERGADGDGGPAVLAELDKPTGVAFTPAGDLVVTDAMTHVVRRIDATTKNIFRVAGLGYTAGAGGDGGPALDARLDTPLRTIADAAGNLYVADFGNHRIRRIDAVTQQITRVAGSATGALGSSGDDGPALDALLNNPASLALAADGTLYVADFGNHRIRRIDADGVIRPVAGTGRATGSLGGPGGDPRDDLGDGGPAGQASFSDPTGLHLDADGALIVADQGNNRIRRLAPQADGKIGPASVVTTIAGNGQPTWAGDGGDALFASLNRPTEALPLGDGSMLIADRGNQRVRIIVQVENLCDLSCDDGDPCTADSCDEVNGCAHAPAADTDFDGICDLLDNCPQTDNPDQKDGDGDGVGDVCVGVPPPPAADACRQGLATCLPGRGKAKTECLLETVVAGATGGTTVRCKDGDAVCDADPTPGRCGLTVSWCINNTDPRLPRCTARGVRRVKAAATGTPRAAARSARDALLAALGLGTGASSSGPSLLLTPPDMTPDRCTAPVAVAVDVRRRGRKTRPGTLKLATRAFGTGKRSVDADAIRLVCMP